MIRAKSVHSASAFFLFTDAPPSEIYTLSLHDALPILCSCRVYFGRGRQTTRGRAARLHRMRDGIDGDSIADRESTRLNSSHRCISYAVFCLKKKKSHTSNTEFSGASGLCPTTRRLSSS